MNNSKIWLVVNPTVGVPLFLGAVAVGSFAVHLAVVTNTTWVSDFLSGAAMNESAAIEAPVQRASANALYLDTAAAIPRDATEATVVFSDGTTARLVFDKNAVGSNTLALNTKRPAIE